MFSGVRKLGESQDMADDIIQDQDEGGDVDFVSVNYLSPDGGYPPQRISNYDEQLIQHQTLNGMGMSRMAAPFLRNTFVTRAFDVNARTRTGAPRGGAVALTPQMAPQSAARHQPTPMTWMDRGRLRLMRR